MILVSASSSFSFFFFFNDTATTEIYTLSLHGALPICRGPPGALGVEGDPQFRAGAARRPCRRRGEIGEHGAGTRDAQLLAFESLDSAPWRSSTSRRKSAPCGPFSCIPPAASSRTARKGPISDVT